MMFLVFSIQKNFQKYPEEKGNDKVHSAVVIRKDILSKRRHDTCPTRRVQETILKINDTLTMFSTVTSFLITQRSPFGLMPKHNIWTTNVPKKHTPKITNNSGNFSMAFCFWAIA